MTVIASAFDWRENEFYETEEWVTEAVLRHFPLRGLIVWEPSAGAHRIANVLREHGAKVITSDITEYPKPGQDLFSVPETVKHDFEFDFVKVHEAVSDQIDMVFNHLNVDAIFTNPPFGKQNRTATTYCRMALKRCDGWVFILCTAKFDFGSSRTDLFRNNPRFHAKINLIDRLSFTDDGKSGTEDHAIYVWRPKGAPVTPPTIIYEGKRYGKGID